MAFIYQKTLFVLVRLKLQSIYDGYLVHKPHAPAALDYEISGRLHIPNPESSFGMAIALAMHLFFTGLHSELI
jgi:hypothetical protein